MENIPTYLIYGIGAIAVVVLLPVFLPILMLGWCVVLGAKKCGVDLLDPNDDCLDYPPIDLSEVKTDP